MDTLIPPDSMASIKGHRDGNNLFTWEREAWFSKILFFYRGTFYSGSKTSIEKRKYRRQAENSRYTDIRYLDIQYKYRYYDVSVPIFAIAIYSTRFDIMMYRYFFRRFFYHCRCSDRNKAQNKQFSRTIWWQRTSRYYGIWLNNSTKTNKIIYSRSCLVNRAQTNKRQAPTIIPDRRRSLHHERRKKYVKHANANANAKQEWKNKTKRTTPENTHTPHTPAQKQIYHTNADRTHTPTEKPIISIPPAPKNTKYIYHGGT